MVTFTALVCVVSIFGDKNDRIIIVGSGAAGIAAASRLIDNGFTNVTILEAQNRIGGRVFTTKIGKKKKKKIFKTLREEFIVLIYLIFTKIFF